MEFSEEEQVRASVFRCGLLLRPASAEAPRDGGDGGEGKRGSGTDRDEEAGEIGPTLVKEKGGDLVGRISAASRLHLPLSPARAASGGARCRASARR